MSGMLSMWLSDPLANAHGVMLARVPTGENEAQPWYLSLESPAGRALNFELDEESARDVLTALTRRQNEAFFPLKWNDVDFLVRALSLGGSDVYEAIRQTMLEVGARSDVERIAVIAYHLEEQGDGTIDRQTMETAFELIRQPSPMKWSAAFSNSHRQGYIEPAGERGRWRLSAAGREFATTGKRTRRR